MQPSLPGGTEVSPPVSSTGSREPGTRNADRAPSSARPGLTWSLFVALLWCLVATCARASATTTVLGPGSVTPTLWYRADQGFNAVTGAWTDTSGSGVVASAPVGASAPVSQSVDANYNPGISFNGTSQWLRGQLASSAFSNGSSYIFVVSTASAGSSSNPLSAVLSGYNAGAGPSQGISYSGGGYGVDSSTNQGLGPLSGSAGTTVLSDASYPTALTGSGATLTQNGTAGSNSPTGSVSATQWFDIGGRTSNGAVSNLFAGNIDEVLYYNNVSLSATQIKAIRSYLALKYGITLGSDASPVTYYAGNGSTVVWLGSTTYQNDIAGIGHDATTITGLNQQMSHSVNSTANGNTIDLNFASGTAVNSTITKSAFPANTFLIWGDNGGSTTISNVNGIYRMARIWLAQFQSTATSSIVVQVPATQFAGIQNPIFWVSYLDPTFGTVAARYPVGLTNSGGYLTTTISVPSTGGVVQNYYFSFGSAELTGTVFEDVNYGGGAGRDTSAGGAGLAGARIEEYDASGNYITSTTSATNGSYVLPAGVGTTYTVRVVTPTKSSRTGGSASGLVAVQTYRTTATSGTAGLVTDHVGGETPSLIDAPANLTSASLSSLTTASALPQSIASATISAASTGVSGINFGFNFDTIVNTNSSGQGSFAQFIANANALGGVSSLAQVGQTAGTQTSIFMIGNGSAHNGLRTGSSLLSSGVATFSVASALPAISNAGTVIDGTTETANDGNTNSGTWGTTGGTVGTTATALATINRPTVQLVGTSSVAQGLSIAANNVTVRGLAISGFGTGGGTTSGEIAVSGSAAGTLIEKSVIGTSATAFSSGNGAGGNGIVVSSTGGGTIQDNMIGYMSGAPIATTGSSGWTIASNEIRSAQGSAGYAGVSLNSTTGSTLSGNLITGNPASGIAASGTAGTLTITNNSISSNGGSIAGSPPTQTPGIALSGTGSTISQNVLNANYGAGILVANGSSQNTITKNSIYANGTVAAANGATASGEIGIDLESASNAAGTGSAPYVTPNRSGGVGTGGNNLFNFPIIDGAAISAGNLTLTGYGRAGATIEVYIADATPAGIGFGQGKTLVATLTEGATSGTVDTTAATGTYTNPRTSTNPGSDTNVGTDAANRFAFSLPTPSGVSVGSVLTASEFLAANGTSEFGPNIIVSSTLPAPLISTVLSVSPSGVQPPGTALTYSGTFQNAGTSQAYNVSIVDPIPANTDFKIGSVSATLTNTNLTYSVQYSNDANLATSTWSYTPVSGAGGAPANYDRTVTGVRLVLSGTFDFNSPYNTGSFSLAVRIQ
jgi:uncharacterized repeat protein (TIGR01451 family)